MSKEQKRHAMEQIRKVEAVLRRWDPIGVLSNEDGPADEYDSYAPHIVSLAQNCDSLAELVIHLHHFRTETLRLPANRELDKEAAEEIIRAVGRQV